MSLLKELEDRREAVANKLEDAFLLTETLRAELDDFDIAIAALQQVDEPNAPGIEGEDNQLATERFPYALNYVMRDGSFGGGGYEAGNFDAANSYFNRLSTDATVKSAELKVFNFAERTWATVASYEAHPQAADSEAQS